MHGFSDYSVYMQVAVFMVGFTQLIKKFFEIENKKLNIIVSIVIGIAGGILLHFAPDWVFNTLVGVSVGVVFYEGILKNLERIFSGKKERSCDA